jgi:hypothetical protein
MSLADACLVRMSEVLPDPQVITTDTDFKIYRRHSWQVVPCVFFHGKVATRALSYARRQLS